MSNIDDKFHPLTPSELGEQNRGLIENFEEVLDTISSMEDKRKLLWKNIYSNAVTDRSNAYLCFSDLYMRVHGNPTEHAIHGQTLTKYLERMSKANDQLIKLADLINKIKEEDNLVDGDDALDQIQTKLTAANPFSKRKN